MCGIFGVVVSEQSVIEPPRIHAALVRMMLLSQTRGKEASGIACVAGNQTTILKRPIRASRLLKHPDFVHLQDLWLQRKARQPLLMVGHARMVTNGSSFEHYNNQPVVRGKYFAVHNGIIVNDLTLWNQNPNLQRAAQVDTEVFLALVEDSQRNQGLSFGDAYVSALRQLEGANSIICVDAERQQLAMGSSNGSLYFSISPSGSELVFSSEKLILLNGLDKLLGAVDSCSIKQLSDKHSVVFSLKDNFLEQLSAPSLGANTPSDSHTLTDLSPRAGDLELYRDPLAPIVSKNSSARACLLHIDFDAIKALKRCAKCVLPATFPFIAFDSQGVCNYCTSGAEPTPKGISKLEEYLARVKLSKRHNILVPISGGRDSCYGLHYICKELRLKPVAYTYDWGMVTDLARRNISRMCGALGVEHILVSADIARKRANIRKNVVAWLLKPHLGTIPLFMAGDKQFFYFANLIKKQLNLDATLFSMNPLERTDFKVAFCGIDENFKKNQHYNLGLINKLRLLSFYGKQFLSNPAYINSSLLDSVFAFISYYLIPRDYVSLYDYIQWDQQVIEDTLLGTYDWELAKDTLSTWRIGDGTASFYNYIYCRVAGFSENDTLRSNLIRIGQISREQAMERLYEDNRPRFESIKWYCDTVGIDFAAAINRINSIPTLYNSEP